MPDWNTTAADRAPMSRSGSSTEPIELGCLGVRTAPDMAFSNQLKKRSTGVLDEHPRILVDQLPGLTTAVIRSSFQSPVTLKWAAAPFSKASIRLWLT